jgi:hypothetical protein
MTLFDYPKISDRSSLALSISLCSNAGAKTPASAALSPTIELIAPDRHLVAQIAGNIRM